MKRRRLAHLALMASGAAVLLAVGVLLVELRSGPRESGGSPPPGERPLPPAARATARVEREPLRGAHPDPTAQQQAATADAIALYDRGEYERARTAAATAIESTVDPIVLDRMQSIAATASCYLSDADQARVWYARLEPATRQVIATRCRGLGIEL